MGGAGTRDDNSSAVGQQPPGVGAPESVATTAPSADHPVPAAEQDRPASRRSRRTRPTMWAAVGALGLVAGILALFTRGSAASQSYAVAQSSAGVSTYLTLPVHVGPRTQLMEDASPIWTYYPILVPTSPTDTYETTGANYAAPTLVVRGVTLDVIFAKGDNGHSAVFSVSPQQLVDLVTTSMNVHDPRRYPAGDSNTTLECGVYATSPICYWADRSTLGFLEFLGSPGTVDELAALAPTFQTALIRQ